MTVFRWGTITDDSPLRVRLDADSLELPFTPDSLIDPAELEVGDRVRCEVASGRVIIHGKSGGVSIPEPPEVEYPVFTRNLIRNARFRINQRGASSGTSLGNNAYFLDGWQSGTTTNSVTWSGSDDAGRVVTVGASEVIRQVIERRDVVAGDYLLVWDGTANARVYNEGSSAPSFTADSGSGRTVMPVTLDGSANVRVEFQAGTVSNVMLIRGDVDPGFFIDTPFAEDLARCQRYYYRTPTTTASDTALGNPGFYVGTTTFYLPFVLPVPMRAVPTVGSSTIGNLVVRSGSGNNRAASAISVQPNQVAGAATVVVQLTTATDTNGMPGVVRSTGSGAYIEFSAEL